VGVPKRKETGERGKGTGRGSWEGQERGKKKRKESRALKVNEVVGCR
jgi:hypothetical protein